MNDLLNDISTRSKSILNRMDEIDVIIKNIKIKEPFSVF